MPTVPSVETETLAAAVGAADDRDRREVIAPANGEQLGTVPECIPEDVETAFEHANDAQESWAARSLKERGEILWDIADAVLEERSWLADVLQAETGKARADAIEEVFDIAVNARYYASRADSLLGPTRRQGAIPLLTKTVEHRHPKGAIGLIVSWNHPLTLAVSDALPALLAGNSVVLKPAEETPFSLLAAA
ncbi:MAG: aldehyde dehydrogenase family protein, partial [Halapricum sp.]